MNCKNLILAFWSRYIFFSGFYPRSGMPWLIVIPLSVFLSIILSSQSHRNCLNEDCLIPEGVSWPWMKVIWAQSGQDHWQWKCVIVKSLLSFFPCSLSFVFVLFLFMFKIFQKSNMAWSRCDKQKTRGYCWILLGCYTKPKW